MKTENTKLKLHPRNQHRERYDFAQLIQTSPILGQYVRLNEYGDLSVDFSNSQAVKALNQALLKHFYGVCIWDIPPENLCPPIPGRADYLHYLADLLNDTNAGQAEMAKPVRVLDIGVGANMIYPLIGTHVYEWQFVGADIELAALQNAQYIINANQLFNHIELRLQSTKAHIFKGIIRANECFTLTMCNPPFHSSAAEAQAGTERKWKGLNKPHLKSIPSQKLKLKTLNFSGHSTELYCEGGELAFVLRMISESQLYATQCLWFTTLVSKVSHLPGIYRALNKVNAITVKTIPMAQGQKQSRIVAWTFLNIAQQQTLKPII